MTAFLRYAVAEFGPLIVFWGLAATAGLKAAIAGSLAAILADSAWRRWRGRPFTRLYLVVSGLTVAFGIVDLMVRTPFLLVYEAPLTNALTGLAFTVGAFGPKPMVQELAEARPGADIPRNSQTRRFFQIFTLLWAAYFFLKALAYLWLAAALPMAQAMAARSVGGAVSLGLMIALSVTQGRRMFWLFRGWGWLGPEPART